MDGTMPQTTHAVAHCQVHVHSSRHVYSSPHIIKPVARYILHLGIRPVLIAKKCLHKEASARHPAETDCTTHASSCRHANTPEGCSAEHELIQQDAKAPPVHRRRVASSIDDLRTHNRNRVSHASTTLCHASITPVSHVSSMTSK
jgi:hypothetical protein